MGLCKCPKRRVTNQFCFEHRVNVCEYCMVTNHPKCIVQSYLQWLQDSDYNPICEICTKNLSDGDCIRFTCYHVFHWGCVENRFRALPRTTAPAGYQCPSCAAPIFPPPNLVSPVADDLREKLAGVNWARAGLGLPLLSEDQDLKSAAGIRSSPHADGFFTPDSPSSQRGTPVGASDDESANLIPNGNSHSIIQIQEDARTVKRMDNIQGSQAPRRASKSIDHLRDSAIFDHDENKYKQKSTFAWISRWWKNSLPGSRLRRAGSKRTWMAIIIICAIITLVYLLSQRETELDSPFGILHMENSRTVQKN